MSQFQSEQIFYTRIQSLAAEQPEAVALCSISAPPTTFHDLATQMHRHMGELHRYGLGEHSVAALVHPEGPGMAAAFLSISASTACAPLNPRYREEEFLFYLENLNADVLITARDFETEARKAANRLDIPILEIFSPPGSSSGQFRFQGVQPSTAPETAPDPDSIALLLHTSGTTSRPKLVPLTHRNLLSSAENIAQSLQLDSRDMCLNIMPLFHVHGLIGAVLSSLTAGASVCCTPGFLAPQFLKWLNQYKPTWWTAVPTMQQAILERVALEGPTVSNDRLRFIRSCSAPLPPAVLGNLETIFGVPVIEAYGMTEASHQITINPLPPLVHKPGSVGLPGETEVAIADSSGGFLAEGDTGEVVLRGPNITRGYVNNPAANEKTFFDGWFRTGDEGYLDKDGYLFLTGRIKEMINRGGEKITPREIDEALLAHPEIEQALCFAVPHTKLGEEVAAIVVRKENGTVTQKELRDFVARSLSDFKVPALVLFQAEIPKGPTGKPQRVGLANKLGLSSITEEETPHALFQKPVTDTEKELHALWIAVLERDPIGVQDPFTALGGDSIMALILVARVRETFDVNLSLMDFFDAATIREQAAMIDNLTENTDTSV
ncbi:MAG: AMP-binding protein [Anaerolineales bacterium]|nr:AMP-binding protein [Anaerolineales bacterium]